MLPKNRSSEITVIGAGIVGVCTALHLLMRGLPVRLIDQGSLQAAASFGNSGIFETSYVLPFKAPAFRRLLPIFLNRDPAVHVHYRSLMRHKKWILNFFYQSRPENRLRNGNLMRPLIAQALEEHRYLMQETDAEKHMVPQGRVKLYRREDSFLADGMERDVAKEKGVPFEVLTPQEFSQIEPYLHLSYYRAVRWTSSVRCRNPGALVEAYRKRFRSAGGLYQIGDVRRLEPLSNEKWKIHTNENDFETHQIVLCGGAWSPELCRVLGYRFPLNAKRGYHRHFKALGNSRLDHAIVDADVGYLICPMETGYRLTTGVEFAERDAPSTPVQLKKILPYARELFDLGEEIDLEPWMGCRPCFADSLPVVGPAPHHPGLWFNFGHGHSGLTAAPATGRLIADLITGDKPFCDPQPYMASRFSL